MKKVSQVIDEANGSAFGHDLPRNRPVVSQMALTFHPTSPFPGEGERDGALAGLRFFLGMR